MVVGSKRNAVATMVMSGALLGALSLFAGPVAAQPAEKQVAVDQTRIAKGRELFYNWGCAACHSLADAKAGGDVGPPLDGNGLTEKFIADRVTHGQGGMPAFGGQMTDAEIADLAYYIAKVAKP